MPPTRHLLPLLLTCLTAPAMAVGNCRYATPEAAAQALYRDYRDFYHRPSPELRHVLTDRFLDQIDLAAQCEASGHCQLQEDPWVNAPDGRIVGAPRFALAEAAAREATVRVSLLRQRGSRLAVREVLISVLRSAERDCWFVDDFYALPEQSLSAHYAALVGEND